MRRLIYLFCSLILVACSSSDSINRKEVVDRNAPQVDRIDTYASLTVGNGEFAYTVDVTGLQSFPELYSDAVPLGTQAQWGWHSFPNSQKYTSQEALVEGYSTNTFAPGQVREFAAANYLRANPHRLHLGVIGFENLEEDKITGINQRLDLWNGVIHSDFVYEQDAVSVVTSCDPQRDMIAVVVNSQRNLPVVFRFPYPTGVHTDDACDWNANDKHSTELFYSEDNYAILKRSLDDAVYYVHIGWNEAQLNLIPEENILRLTPGGDVFEFTVEFSLSAEKLEMPAVAESREASEEYWQNYWESGAFVDFGECKDQRAPELERRVILSQYLLAVQCAGSTPPQETGLTYNSWFGKFHLEMIWWHQAQFALWGHSDLLKKTMPWYHSAKPVGEEIAARQGYRGIRWMKMTDPSGEEAPSNIGSYLIWQQPHIIYLAELLYRDEPSEDLLKEYYELIMQTAEFMASFAKYDKEGDRYVLDYVIPAQERFRPENTFNPPFELCYWHYGLSLAQTWRERMGEERVPLWDEIIEKLSPLTEVDGLYLAAESAPDSYTNQTLITDHMAVLMSYGILPECPLYDKDVLKNTLDWIYENWHWDDTWGWDYPSSAMNAVRLGDPQKAVDILLMDVQKNTYLPNGHNYQNETLRCYLPGNGGLLTAVALMCAGWDGCEVQNPGFPKDGNWNVRWEGLKAMP